jgi:hypothetical protein
MHSTYWRESMSKNNQIQIWKIKKWIASKRFFSLIFQLTYLEKLKERYFWSLLRIWSLGNFFFKMDGIKNVDHIYSKFLSFKDRKCFIRDRAWLSDGSFRTDEALELALWVIDGGTLLGIWDLSWIHGQGGYVD